MTYNKGDILICKKRVNAECLEMSNPDSDIMPGDRFIVTDTCEYDRCQWCVLVPIQNKENIYDAWNDDDHAIIDECFEKLTNILFMDAENDNY